MILKLKYISYVFLFSVLSLTFQSTITFLLKDNTTIKAKLSSNNPQPAEEEDENEKVEIEEDELFEGNSFALSTHRVGTMIIWPSLTSTFTSAIVSINTPPPKI